MYLLNTHILSFLNINDLSILFIQGNDVMYLLTKNATSDVYFKLLSLGGHWHYATYTQFSVGPEADLYRLGLGTFTGNAGEIST